MTFTISPFSFSLALYLWSKSHSWFYGSLWPLQYTKPHLHSIPRSPTFLLQLKHLLRSFCSFLGSKDNYSISSQTSCSVLVRGVELLLGSSSTFSYFFWCFWFLNGKGDTCSRRSRDPGRLKKHRKWGIPCT